MASELDGRTRDVLAALRPPACDLLYALLLAGSATEQELVAATATTQSTANRHLRELAALAIVRREGSGRAHGPNRPWTLRDPEAVRGLLAYAVDLSEQAALAEDIVRQGARERLRPAHQKVRGLSRRTGSG